MLGYGAFLYVSKLLPFPSILSVVSDIFLIDWEGSADEDL